MSLQVISGYVGYRGLYRAIDEGRLDIAVDLVKQDETLGKVGVEYVIRKEMILISSPTLSTKLIRQMHAHSSELWRKSPIETIEKVLEKVDFPQQALVDLASSYKVVYHA